MQMTLDVDAKMKNMLSLIALKSRVHDHGIRNPLYVSTTITAHSALFRLVVDMLYNKSYNELHKILPC